KVYVALVSIVSALSLAPFVGCEKGPPDLSKPPTEHSASIKPAVNASVSNAIPAPPDVSAAPPDAQKTPSGLASRVLTPGTGTDHPAIADTVKVNFTGWLASGKMFESTISRGKPISVPLEHAPPGWLEGVQLMVKGEKRRLWMPVDLA